MSQFHGDNIAMSWFLVVHDGFKLVVWGTGDIHPHQLFNLTSDPNEMNNLASDPAHKTRIQTMLNKMTSVVDYRMVAKNVAKYGLDSMRYWVNRTKDWKEALASPHLRWHVAWKQNPQANVAAIESWLSKPPELQPCRGEAVWPPPTN